MLHHLPERNLDDPRHVHSDTKLEEEHMATPVSRQEVVVSGRSLVPALVLDEAFVEPPPLAGHCFVRSAYWVTAQSFFSGQMVKADKTYTLDNYLALLALYP